MHVAAILAIAAAATAPLPAGVQAFVRDHTLKNYRVALADLNGDRRPEALVYAQDPDQCGSGGCDLYILKLSRVGYRLLTQLSISRPPIRVLPTSSRGWRDIGVRVAGGGVTTAYEAQLRFNGRTYPANPSTPPATRLRRAGGRVVIAP